MEHFEKPHPKLLYSIYKLEQEGKITELEKRKLKELVVLGSNSIFTMLNQYENNYIDKSDFESSLVALVKPQRQKPSKVSIPDKTISDEATSPIGTFLHEKKKRQYAEQQLRQSVMMNPHVIGISEFEEHES